jgi:hypothetical protein
VNGQEILMSMSSRAREAVLVNALAALAGLAWLLPPLAQDPHYHAFADQRSWAGITFAMDVLSNLPFALWGLLGFVLVARRPALQGASRQTALLFFGGLVATAACSAWYHLAPEDATLSVDRYGMSVAFAGLMALAVATRVSPRAGQAIGVAGLLLGVLSVWLWQTSGNLMPWAVYQFGGMALMLGLLLWPRLPGTPPLAWGLVLLFYALAKLLELGDHVVFDATGWVSGHSLKHVVASFAAWPVVRAIWRMR